MYRNAPRACRFRLMHVCGLHKFWDRTHISNLYHIFIETLSLESMLVVACTKDTLIKTKSLRLNEETHAADFVTLRFNQRVLYLPVGSLLLCIVSLNGSTEQMFICFFDRLLNENNVVLRSGIVNIFCVELSVVVSKASLALTMGNAFFAHKYNLLSLRYFYCCANSNAIIPLTLISQASSTSRVWRSPRGKGRCTPLQTPLSARPAFTHRHRCFFQN